MRDAEASERGDDRLEELGTLRRIGTRGAEERSAPEVHATHQRDGEGLDVRDVALGMIRAVELGQPGRRYLLGDENWYVKRVFDFLADLSLSPGEVRNEQHIAARWTDRLAQK